MKPWFSIGAAVIAAGIGAWVWQTRQAETPPASTDVLPPPAVAPQRPEAKAASAPGDLLTRLPSVSYPDLQGQARSLTEWQDKVMVVNFWATWCPPCREETPLFVALQEEYRAKGVQFVGIAIDDKDAVQDFVDSYGVDYPVLIGDMAAVELSRELGNRFSGLPFTVITAPGGEVVIRHFGGMKREQVAPVLDRLTQDVKAP